MNFALETRGLSKEYGRGDNLIRAVDGVDLAIEASETVAVVGKSGSGKSTLMHLLALLDRPDKGEVRIDGMDAAGLSRADVNRLRNRRFGFVFQQFFLTPGMSVLDNVTLPLTIAGLPARERRGRGVDVLERFGIAEKARSRPTDLSGGQKQRVVLARAVVAEPSVIFADEPTGNLDSVTGAIVQDELFALNRNHGITLVIVTHDNDLASRCGRLVQMHDGRLVQERAA